MPQQLPLNESPDDIWFLARVAALLVKPVAHVLGALKPGPDGRYLERAIDGVIDDVQASGFEPDELNPIGLTGCAVGSIMSSQLTPFHRVPMQGIRRVITFTPARKTELLPFLGWPDGPPERCLLLSGVNYTGATAHLAKQLLYDLGVKEVRHATILEQVGTHSPADYVHHRGSLDIRWVRKMPVYKNGIIDWIAPKHA